MKKHNSVSLETVNMIKSKHHEGTVEASYCPAASTHSCRKKFSLACCQWQPERNGNSCCPTEMQSHRWLITTKTMCDTYKFTVNRRSICVGCNQLPGLNCIVFTRKWGIIYRTWWLGLGEAREGFCLYRNFKSGLQVHAWAEKIFWAPSPHAGALLTYTHTLLHKQPQCLIFKNTAQLTRCKDKLSSPDHLFQIHFIHWNSLGSSTELI